MTESAETDPLAPNVAAGSGAGDGSAATSLEATFGGLMEKAKDKWESSGGNEAVARITAHIPDNVRAPVKNFCDNLFIRAHLRSFHVFAGIGEKRPFYLEGNIDNLSVRFRQNMEFFYPNYMLMTAVLFCLAVLFSPGAVAGILVIALAWVWLIRNCHDSNDPQSGTIKIFGRSVSQRTAVVGLSVFSGVFLLVLLAGIFWWTLFSSAVLSVSHAALRDASMHHHKDTDENSKDSILGASGEPLVVDQV